jgi:hypothetical protein
MSYFHPFLPVLWFGSFDLGALAAEVNNVAAFNDFLEAEYAAPGDSVADVEGAFSTTDTTLQPDGIPLEGDRLRRDRTGLRAGTAVKTRKRAPLGAGGYTGSV